MANTLSLTAEHGTYLQGLHHNSNPADANIWSSTSAAGEISSDAFKWPAVPPACHTTPETPDFLARIEQVLRIDDAGLAAALPCKTGPVRSSSSAYPSAGHNTPRVQSPVSEYHQGNRLSFSGLSKFGRANDDLSNLRSNSPASACSETGREGVADTSHHELVADTAAAITEWQDAGEPLRKVTYNNYALADSSELFPSDSLSQQQEDDFSLSPSTPPSAAMDPTAASCTSSHDSDALNNLGHQYDGTLDARRDGSPEVKHGPAPALDGSSRPFHPSKRKASTFSLRSLTRSLTKRRRLAAIRQWASRVYHTSSRRLVEAYRRFKKQHHQMRPGANGPWDHGHPARGEAPAQSVNREPKGSNAVFEFERRRRSEDWWKDGVSRYRAPSGMFAKK
ncbi:hypothetical protein C2857_000851 [Epichloe festucae Fl1]|uniref:Uncharacterized protein n=1 Tax=Epichloe festucae (strain Fl1) TaxID=877507 RepID=A0A7U3SMW9_EPIFF|nr:hypothetical protein C2857_000851 [Epichloe festucae Fl1]